MITPSRSQLKFQLERVGKTPCGPLLVRYALVNDLPLAFVYAVGSRETNLINMEGDGGNGKGIMQVDVQHSIARRTDWKNDPLPLIAFACLLLSKNLARAKRNYPAMTPQQHLKLAAAAYNCGWGNVEKAVPHGDCDLYTTGKDYGRDVLARMVLFQMLLG